jgi:bifunctional DNA-binding transcriptional regulator/antitoxin component of YhaV-PrlF toxin-antitoxin module
MATEAIVTFSNGKLEVPVEVQEAMHLTEGTKLRLVRTATNRLILEPAPLPSVGPSEGWRSLRGVLSDHPEHDTSKARAEERAWELEHDERKFCLFPER